MTPERTAPANVAHVAGREVLWEYDAVVIAPHQVALRSRPLDDEALRPFAVEALPYLDGCPVF
ncbi:MAG TPA: hypothetical protein VMZ22_06530 [Acidimicrobiales bacterium]|nr:hypothetical protein [Acidimicrobiales bacterium]